MIVFGQSGCIRLKVVVFDQKWLYPGKNVCIREKVAVFGQSGCILAKMVVFGQSGFFRAKVVGCIRAKVVVFGQKWLYSGKSGCNRAKLLYLGKKLWFSGKSCCLQAKQQLNVKPTESKMLGLKWDKHQDTLAVIIPTEQAKPTKRGILGKLASIYSPLGLIAPLTLTGKQIYRDVCEAKKLWDALLNNEHLKRWRRWKLQLPSEQQVPRPIVHHREKVQEVELHSFGDASISGVGAAVYAVVRQESGTTQRLVAAKGRLAKQNLTIPRLELVGAHMATNLLINVGNAYDNLPPPMLYGWLDSTVALHWIKGNGGATLKWHELSEVILDIEKTHREVLNIAQDQPKPEPNVFDDLLERHDLKATKLYGSPMMRSQTQDSQRPHFIKTSRALNLQPNARGLLECHGRIQGKYPIYLPADSMFTRKLVHRIYVETLHGGVTLTMAAVREDYWVPTLRRVVKSIRSACWGCKRFRVQPLAVPPPGLLPSDRNTGGTVFEVIGTDYAGPIVYQLTPQRKGKAY